MANDSSDEQPFPPPPTCNHNLFSINQEAIFSQGSGLAGAVGGNPGAASFLMAGLPGKRAMEITDRLTDHGVDPSRLLFNDFF